MIKYFKYFNKIQDYLSLFKLSINKNNYFFEVLVNDNVNEFKKINSELEFLYNKIFKNRRLNSIKDDLINNEIKKSYIKSSLNYNGISKLAAFKTVYDFAKKNKFKMQDIFYTSCYSILHLPNDKIEEGNFHIDQDGSKTIYTIWTPITDYNYRALSYFKFGYLFYKLLNKISQKKFSFFYNYINVLKFKSILWSGFFLHKGNLNVSTSYTSASVIWVSIGQYKKSDISYNLADSIKEFRSKEIKEDGNKILINDEFNELLLLINLIINFSDQYDYLEINKFLNNLKNENIFSELISKKNFKYSFFFSILAQRMKTMQKRNIKNNLKNNENLIIYFDILSVLLGLQSYSSFMRIIDNELLNKNDIKQIKLKLIELEIFNGIEQIEEFIKDGYQQRNK